MGGDQQPRQQIEVDVDKLEIETDKDHLAEFEKVFLGRMPVDTDKLIEEVTNNPRLAHARGRHGYTLLHFATNENHFDLAELLLRLGADVGAMDEPSGTPLHVSVGGLRMVQLLLNHGASPNLLDGHGLTPLSWAMKYYAFDIVRLLLAHGAIPRDDHTRQSIESLRQQDLL